MKKFKIISIILICTLAFNSVVYADQADVVKEYVIITEKDEIFTVLEEEDISKEQSEYTDDVSVGIIETSLSLTEAEDVAENENVILVEENIELTADYKQESQDVNFNQKEDATWNIQMINATDIPKSSGNKVKVGVIDSGICYSSDISISGGKDFIEDEESSYFLYEDLSGHGTSVAGVIASKNIYGIDSNVEMYSIKVLNGDNKTNLSKVIQAIYWSIENKMNIINLSLGTGQYSSALEKAINDAYSADVLVVASAGNGESISYPAAYDNTIAVGSIDNNGDIVSQNSNLYQNIIFAPGENIITNATFESVHMKSGTSMAAPHITALAASLWKKFLDEKYSMGNAVDKVEKVNDFIRALLYASAKKTEDDLLIADLAFAQERFEEFLDSYVPNEETSLGSMMDAPDNTQQLETFEDTEVEALWGGSAHENTVNGISYTYFNQDEQNFLKRMATVPDNNKYTLNNSFLSISETYGNYLGFNDYFFPYLSTGNYFVPTTNLRENAVLHGRGNYVASLKFLYTVSKNLMYNDYGDNLLYIIEQAIEDAYTSGDLSSNQTLYGSNDTFCGPGFNWSVYNASNGYEQFSINKTDNLFTTDKMRDTLEKSIYIVCNSYCNGQENITGKTQRLFAFKVLGLALHLSGDIYAHKTVVPLNVTFSNENLEGSNRAARTIYRGNASDFYGRGRWSAKNGIKTLITANSTITTQQIVEFQIGDSSSVRHGYPDYTGFLPTRYSVASCNLVVNLVNGIAHQYQFDFEWFLHSNYSLKLANLKIYAYRIGVQPTAQAKMDILNSLDSRVSVSDLYVHNSTSPNVSSNNSWSQGYVSSY